MPATNPIRVETITISVCGDCTAAAASVADRITVRRDAAAWKIADYLLHQPVIDSPLIQQELNIAAHNVNTAIDH